jgi:ABC-type Fe3+ transport system permease subunit
VPKTASRFWFPLLLGAIATAGMATLWLTEPRVARLWLNTAWLAGGAVLVALPLGTAAAVAIFKTDVPG